MLTLVINIAELVFQMPRHVLKIAALFNYLWQYITTRLLPKCRVYIIENCYNVDALEASYTCIGKQFLLNFPSIMWG